MAIYNKRPASPPSDTILVESPEDLSGVLLSSVVYRVVGALDMSGTGISIEVPVTGLYIEGIHQGVSSIFCSDLNYTLFTSPVGGSGDLFVDKINHLMVGTGSRVYGLTDVDGTHAVEALNCNYTGCSSLGELTNYRQILGENIGRFGGTPELTLSGPMNGVRETLSITRGLSNLGAGALFKAGTGLIFSGRFLTDINCDLPTTGALLDFFPANFSSEEQLQLRGCNITRDGVLNPSDSGLLPNIGPESTKSLFKGNVGVLNTKKYLESSLTSEAETVVTNAGEYYPLEGVFTTGNASHISMPVNGEYEILSGSSVYDITADLTLESTQGNIIDVKVTKSTDGGVTFDEDINHVRRVVNNNVGPRDVAFVPINFTRTLNKGDRVRLEVENVGGTNNITAEIGSFLSIREE